MDNDSVRAVLAYHARTRLGIRRTAAGPQRLDWANEPDPFRSFEGAVRVGLDLPDADDTPPYDALFEPGRVPVHPLDRAWFSRLFYFSLAISAWKEFRGARWSLRVNPSSGDLHPTECYIVTDAIVRPSLYHYMPKQHALERRAEWDRSSYARLVAGLPQTAALLVLTTIPWRESWKYGERAYRYCQHDAGHALAALRFAACMLGWKLVRLPNVGDEEIEQLVGLDRQESWHAGEKESPVLLSAVVPADSDFDPLGHRLPESPPARWFGRANRLSRRNRAWSAVDDVEAACRRSSTPEPRQRRTGSGRAAGRAATSSPRLKAIDFEPCRLPAGRLIRQRRSALDLDGSTVLTRQLFYRMLRRVVPAVTPMPFDVLHHHPEVQLGIFVHRVEGLTPGLYLLGRDPRMVRQLRRAMRRRFAWRKPASCPAGLALYLLEAKDVRRVAVATSCDQDIAGDGAFALAMLARFDAALRERGAHFYRNLHWEAGVIGQVLYLEAEAAGLRATGMGCFLDDPAARAFGIEDPTFRSIYHFTMGGEKEDPRLTTLPAYPAS